MSDFRALRGEWNGTLGRRATLGGALEFWTPILDAWASWEPGTLAPLALGEAECRRRWEQGISLLAEAPLPDLPAEALEGLLGPMVARLATTAPDGRDQVQRFVEAWDRGEVGPWALAPLPDRDGRAALEKRLGLGAHLLPFLAQSALRPPLEDLFRDHRSLPEGLWGEGPCPWCGGPPAWADVAEDGRRLLSCHLCGGQWIAPRLRCPFCRAWDAKELVRLLGEGVEEGYLIEACRVCRVYLKGVDRRERWNAGAPVLEDWGSPHLDAYAAGEGYWRPTPSLAQLLPAAPS